MVEEEGMRLKADIAEVRNSVKTEGVRLKHILSIIGLGAAFKKKTRKKTKAD